MYTIKRAAEILGTTESTLRAWERRYGVGTPGRSESGYRIYDEAALAELRLMQSLLADGWSVREAAAETVRRRAAAPPAGPDEAAFGEDSPGGTGRGEVGLGEHEELAHLAAAFDTRTLAATLDQRFATASFERVVDQWLLPSLATVGQGWVDGEVTVAGEHFVAHAVTRRLAAAYDAAGQNASAPMVALGLAPGVHHDLGLLSFAAAARRAGLPTLYLGADVPVDAWIAAVEPAPVAAAVLAVPMTHDARATTEVVAALHAARPDLLVAVGGGHQELAPASCLRLGHSIGDAAALLAQALHAPHRPPAAGVAD